LPPRQKQRKPHYIHTTLSTSVSPEEAKRIKANIQTHNRQPEVIANRDLRWSVSRLLRLLLTRFQQDPTKFLPPPPPSTPPEGGPMNAWRFSSNSSNEEIRNDMISLHNKYVDQSITAERVHSYLKDLTLPELNSAKYFCNIEPQITDSSYKQLVVDFRWGDQ